MNVLEAIQSRRTVRLYDSERAVPRDVVEKLIELACMAPSACNNQNWLFIPVDDAAMLSKLGFVGAFHAKLSPTSIFVFYDANPRFVNHAYEDHIQSASAAVMTLIYAAHELGIGTNWVCDLPNQGHIKQLFGVPGRYRLICMINIGYPRQSSFPPKRIKGVSTIMSWNRYEEREQEMTGMYQPGYHEPPFIKKWGRRALVWLHLRTGNERFVRLVHALSLRKQLR